MPYLSYPRGPVTTDDDVDAPLPPPPPPRNVDSIDNNDPPQLIGHGPSIPQHSMMLAEFRISFRLRTSMLAANQKACVVAFVMLVGWSVL